MTRISALKPARRLAAAKGLPSSASSTGGSSLNKASGRILRVLLTFATAEEKTLAISELSVSLGMTKNMVFRALNTLAGEGLVVRGQRGRYALGRT